MKFNRFRQSNRTYSSHQQQQQEQQQQKQIQHLQRQIQQILEQQQPLFNCVPQNDPEDDWYQQQQQQLGFRFSGKSLLDILKESPVGRTLLNFNKYNKKLTDNERHKLCNIMLEYVFENDVVLRPQDFEHIVKDITKLFPEEEQILEYYYIPRSGRKNPSGKLFSKYFNMKAKRRRLDNPVGRENTANSASQDSGPSYETEFHELDESVQKPLKEALKADCNDWTLVCNRWASTYALRRKDVLQMDTANFFIEWPTLKDIRASTLIDMDFDFLYPNKQDMLKTKWNFFRDKIKPYYQLKIVNPSCKAHLENALNSPLKDAEDCILTMLLNSVLQSNARISNSSGRKVKPSIQDTQDCFVLHLIRQGGVRNKIQELVDKGFITQSTIQPFVVVDGDAFDSSRAVYVYLDDIFYRFDTFVDALDCAFKIYHILSIPYPVVCAKPWTFIQNYFYDIKKDSDVKSASIASLSHFLNN